MGFLDAQLHAVSVNRVMITASFMKPLMRQGTRIFQVWIYVESNVHVGALNEFIRAIRRDFVNNFIPGDL